MSKSWNPNERLYFNKTKKVKLIPVQRFTNFIINNRMKLVFLWSPGSTMRTLTGEYPYQRNGDYLSWVKFMLGGFTSAAKKRIALIEQYEALIVKDSGKLKKLAFSENILLVYDYYKANLASEIPKAAKKLNLSFNTVSKVVELLQKKKILELLNKQVRHRKFIFRKAADLFL